MIEIDDLPHLIASLNAVSVCFLTAGFIFIKSGNRQKHRLMMICALVASALFLVVYVYYKLNSGFAKFGGEGIIRPIYFTFLIVHVIGAILLTPLVPILVFRAWKEYFSAHKKLARYVWPLWMYVGISGVIVYLMTVHIYPYTGA